MPMAVVLVFLVVASQIACSGDRAANLRRYQLTGVVAGHEASPPRVVVAHDAVNGLMPAMSMAFEIRGDAPPLRDGDRIVSTLVVSDSRSWLENVRITGRGRVTPAPVSPTSLAPAGAAVPDFGLVDQNGEVFSLSRFGGRVVVVTFIYTRCPLPDFCPLMVKHLEAVRRRVNDERRGASLALVGITLEPAFDTPDVLRAYGESRLKGPTPFNQWTLATGTSEQIEDAARFFGVAYRVDGDVVTHTLSTSIVGHDGRIIQTLASNSWRPDELFDVVLSGLERGSPQSTK
jgi:protein SCO1/2